MPKKRGDNFAASQNRFMGSVWFRWGSNYHLTANNWHEGYVYDPENGKTTSAKMKQIDHSEKTRDAQLY